jgi:hypothetical protein
VLDHQKILPVKIYSIERSAHRKDFVWANPKEVFTANCGTSGYDIVIGMRSSKRHHKE